MSARGIRTIRIAAVAVALAHLGGASLAVAASGGRSIPRGELTPQVIEKVYDSPRGEVQFTVIENTGSRSGFLRNNRGHLMGFTEVRGGRECEEWFLSAKTEEVPARCEFLFYDQLDGRYLSVRSEQLEESTIFAMHSNALQARVRRPVAGGRGPGGGNVPF